MRHAMAGDALLYAAAWGLPSLLAFRVALSAQPGLIALLCR